MKIIVDSGSTKSIWTFCYEDGTRKTITSIGLNPFVSDLQNATGVVKQDLKPPQLDQNTELFFYGSGCKGDGLKRVEKFLQNLFPGLNKIEVHSDLLGTARALFGNSEGIVCILGTGSNIAYYDGQSLSQDKPALGYLLGDEGGGFHLGKLILEDYFYGRLNKKQTEAFENLFQSDGHLLSSIYASPRPNEKIASVSRFLQAVDEKYCEQKLEKVFSKFYVKHLSNYLNRNLPIGFCGSIAYHFQKKLSKVLATKGIEISMIIKDPMEGLINYHCK